MEAQIVSSAVRVSRKSAHRRCERCGKVVSRRTIVCKRCGKKQRIDPRSALLLCAGIFLLGVFAVATAGARLPFPLPGRRVAAAPAPLLAPAPVATGTMTATELWDLYSLDSAKADARFKNKPVSVTGRVAEVRRDFHNNLLLRLSTDQPFENVRATVEGREDADHAAPVAGQTVTLRCTGHGALIGSPILDACVVI